MTASDLEPPEPEVPPPMSADLPAPDGAPPPDGRGPRAALAPLVAAGLVAAFVGAGLFSAGFLLGGQQARTPGTPSDREAIFEPFWDVYDAIHERFVGDVDDKAMVEGAIKGLFGAIGDPFSQYLTSDEYRRSISGLSGSFEGIGAVMTTRDDAGTEGCATAGETCHIVVLRTIRDGPAKRAGLRPDDEVVSIDGVSVSGKTIDQTVALVRGPRGTTVRLSIVRDGAAPVELAIVRDLIQTEVVSSEVMADGQVGYLRLEGFSSSAADDFRAELSNLVGDRGLTRIILDLRGDPGGFVDAAERIASEFVASGPIFWEEYADGTQVVHEAVPGGVATDPRIRIVVLIDGGSASASEIVAGALQDSGRARLVGQKSFGKGTIQQWQTLTNDSGGFRLSVARWLTPAKRSIEGVGLEPDVPVSVPSDATGDPVLTKALELLAGSDS